MLLRTRFNVEMYSAYEVLGARSTTPAAAEVRRLTLKYMHAANRHFERRIRLFVKWLKSSGILGGVQDVVVRIEFQDRGTRTRT